MKSSVPGRITRERFFFGGMGVVPVVPSLVFTLARMLTLLLFFTTATLASPSNGLVAASCPGPLPVMHMLWLPSNSSISALVLHETMLRERTTRKIKYFMTGQVLKGKILRNRMLFVGLKAPFVGRTKVNCYLPKAQRKIKVFCAFWRQYRVMECFSIAKGEVWSCFPLLNPLEHISCQRRWSLLRRR